MSDISTRAKGRVSVRATDGIILVLIFGIALSLRVWAPYDGVFTGDWVRFGGNDPWYHMRLVENLVQHFPHSISFDPYAFYPYGQNVAFAPFFDLFLAFPIWVIGLGSPTQHTIETIGAYFPAILGALVSIPVYFIGRELFSRNAGLLAAALIVILPGQFLERSLLGFTDHHVAEVLFTTTTILFLILAFKRAKERELSFNHIRNREWGIIRKPLIYALLAGIALGTYLVSWAGGLLFVFVIFGSVVLLYIIDHLRGKPTDYLLIIGVPLFAAALIVVSPFLSRLGFSEMVLMSLIVSILLFPVLAGVSKLMEGRSIRRAYYPLALAGLGSVGVLLFWAIDSSMFHSAVGRFGIFTPDTGALTIAEARPLFLLRGPFSLGPGWDEFTTSLFIAPIALVLVTYAAVKKVSAEKTLFLVWTVIVLVATLGQARFAYYLAVNAALLSGYFCWKMPGWTSKAFGQLGLRESLLPRWRGVTDRRKQEISRGKKKRAKEKRRQTKGVLTGHLGPRVSGGFAILAAFFLVFYPNIGPAMDSARSPAGPNEDWHDALVWLRDNTSDPFQDPDFYYERYERPPTGEGYDYPPSAYGVMNWWDYGHWITTIAHRIPNSNPYQFGARSAARFFTAQDGASASKLLDDLGSKYVIIDIDMATRKFYSMVIWAGKSESQFFETYYRETEEGLQPVQLYYPEYYRSMSSRLYNFGGKEVIPSNSTWVISYIERDGYKVVATEQLFATYEEAEAYVGSQTPPDYRMVGTDPFISAVPLEKLDHYQLVYQSQSPVVRQTDKTIYYVEIFEYLP